MKNAKICIIGAEAWGSAIATAVSNNVLKGDFDARVHIYVYDELVRHNYLSEVMNDQHENIKYLPGIQLPKNLIAVNDLLEAAENADILIFATPQTFVKSYCNILEGKIKSTAFAVSMIKGLDHINDGEIELYSQAISKQLKIPCYSMMCANSAMEMAQGKLCEITIGCNNAEHARVMTTVFQTDNCKVVATNDVHGVELCGTLKDIIALGAGFIDGLRLGDNARVAALHLGLKEMMRFVKTFYPTAKMSTFFESCGVANSVASSYADKNVTFAKNFVTSGQTVQEIEANLLNGRKLLGPVVAQQVNEVLNKRNILEKFPLFATIHKICEKKVQPMEIVEALRNHPDLSTSSISELLDEEHHMALKNATELMLGNEADMESVPTFSLEQLMAEAGSTAKECLTSSEKQEDWSPFYQYFTENEANRITQAIRNSTPFEERYPLDQKAAAFGSEPFKMECMDDEQKISWLLEEPVQDAMLKPIVASGTITGKTQNAKSLSVKNDFRIVRKGLSTENKGPPNEPSNHSESSSHSGTEETSSPKLDHVDALDLSSETKMDEFIIDNAWLSDQLPPTLLGSKKDTLTGESTANFEPTANDSESKGKQDEQEKSSVAQGIERHLKPKENEFQTLNVKAKTTQDQGTETSAAIYDSIMALEDSEISAKSEVINEEDPFAAFEGIHNYGPEESKSDAATLKALQAEIAELEFNHPKDNDSIAPPETAANISNEMQMIYDEDAMLGTDLKELELEISSLSKTMHLNETEFLQQELAKLHDNNSSSKSLNIDVLMEQPEQENKVHPEHGLSNSVESTEEQTFQDELLKPLSESGTESQNQTQLEENLNTTYSSEPKVEKMQLKDTSTDKSDQEYLLYLDNNMLKPLKDQFYLKSVLTNAESFQLESQRLKHLEESTNKFEENHLSSELESMTQADEVQLEEKSTQNTEYMAKKDVMESEDFRQLETQQIVNKLSDLDTSVGPLQPAETFESEAEEEKLFEENSLRNFINSTNLEDVQPDVEKELFEENSLRHFINSTNLEDVQQLEAKDESGKPSKLDKKEDHGWDWLLNKVKIDDVESIKDDRRKEFNISETDVSNSGDIKLQEAEEQLESHQAAIQMSQNSEESVLNEEKQLPNPVHELKKGNVIAPKEDNGWEWLLNKVKIDDVELIKDDRRKEFNNSETDVSNSEENKLQEAEEQLESRQPVIQMSQNSEESVLNEEKQLPKPVQEMKKGNVIAPKKDHGWEWLLKKVKLDDVELIKDDRRKEFNNSEKDVSNSEENKLQEAEEQLESRQSVMQMSQNSKESVLTEEKQLPNAVREMEKRNVIPPKEDHGWEWLLNKVKIDDVESIKDDRRKEFYNSEKDVSNSEENKLLGAEEQFKSRQAPIQMSQNSEESVLNEEKQVPNPIHEMKKRNVIAPGTPAAPVIKPAAPIHFTPTPAPQTKPLTPQKQQPMRKELPITLNVSGAAPEEVMKGETANDDRPNDKWQESQGRNRFERRKVRTQNLRVERKAAFTEAAEIDFEDERKSNDLLVKGSEAVNESPYALNKTIPAAKDPALPIAEDPQLTARPPIKRKENPINRLGKKFQSIMRKGQILAMDRKVSSKEVKTRTNPLNVNVTEMPQFPKLREGAGTSHRRRAPIRPPFLPPLNPRVRTPHPPFDARDHEYHTLARSYRSPPDLTRSSMVALAPKPQPKHLSTINLSKSSQTRSPSFQIPKGLLRSPSLAKIASAIHLGLLVSFLARRKQSDR